MDPNIRNMLGSMEVNAMLISKLGEVALTKCFENYEGNDITDTEQECIKNYTTKLVQATIHSDVYRYADRGRPQKEA